MVFKAIKLSWRILNEILDIGVGYLLVPMVVCQVDYDRHQHGESLIFISLQNVEEVVVLKEAHGSVCDLKMDSPDASHDSLEESGDQVFNLVDLAHLEYLLEFCQEESLLDAVGKWPVLEESFEQGDSQCSVLGEEEHGASEKLFIELGAGLHFMEWDDNVLEEDNVLVSQRDCEPTDDACEDVEELSCTVEFMCFVD
jgi:hypothetical protein